MRWPERIHARIVDQDIDLAICDFERFSGDYTCTRSIPEVRRNEVCLSARFAYVGNRLFTAVHISAHDHYMHA